ncbi:MAG TPA: NAD(P)H-quinone oxidoreductase [Gemmatimonadaceae bacterium]|jgi:NADPH2:quinone reductase|nr:NAD(P)H-quinone oxidoreductase [Gemmatimonadaceae bacterium]
MRAIEISAPGGPDVLIVGDRPMPAPGPGDVLIRVAAAGVNRPDIAQRKGVYPPPPGASDIPGLEVAGTVVEAGSDVTSFVAGDNVCALVSGGGYAEFCVAPAVQCLPVPRGLSLVEAASLPENYFTVWSNVFDRGRLVRGESLLVQGGSSGIGVCAIQLASAFGATVFATAGSAEKCAACEQLGAARAINYRKEDFVEAVMSATHGRGVDVILDMVGGDYVPRELAALASEGRLVMISTLNGAKTEIDLRAIMSKRASLTGSMLRVRAPEFKGAIARSLLNKVWPLLESGAVKPVVHSQFPLEHAADAHRLMESSAHVGKIMLTL